MDVCFRLWSRNVVLAGCFVFGVGWRLDRKEIEGVKVARYKRKSRLVTAREPNGQPQRSRSLAPSEAKRIRDEAARKARQSEYGTELGRLWLDDKITAPMYEAGKKWIIVSVQRSIALQGP